MHERSKAIKIKEQKKRWKEIGTTLFYIHGPNTRARLPPCNTPSQNKTEITIEIRKIKTKENPNLW